MKKKHSVDIIKHNVDIMKDIVGSPLKNPFIYNAFKTSSSLKYTKYISI